MPEDGTAIWEGARALVTFHGTLVHYDPAARCLRNGLIGTCAANVLAVRNGAHVVLVWRDGETERPLDRSLIAGDEPALLTAEESAAQRLVTLHAEGRYLRAERDGGMAFSHASALDWERFLLVDPDDLGRLEFVLTNRWFSSVDGVIAQPEIDPRVGRHAMYFGPDQFAIADVIEAARASGRELFMTYDKWKTQRYLLYRPLACFVAYGLDEIFQCADVAIRSLFEFGEWDGDVLFITDADHQDFASRFPAEIGDHIKVVEIAAGDVLDYTLARYKMAEVELVGSYQPVLYLDTDIVCDAPVQNLLRSTALSYELQVMPEFAMASPGDYYGQSLLKADGIGFRPDQAGFSQWHLRVSRHS